MSDLLASDLFAISQGSKNAGPESCHWCTAACDRTWFHDDRPPMIGVRIDTSTVKRPGSHYICCGCWLWRRPKVTACFLTGGYKDSQAAKNQSWWITEDHALAIEPRDYTRLWELLLSPPHKFALALLEKTSINEVNNLQCALVNDNKEVKASTDLYFTISNVKYSYTVYELGFSVEHGPDGKDPGVQALWRFIGAPPETFKEKRKQGRPKKAEERVTERTVRAKSGGGEDASAT